MLKSILLSTAGLFLCVQMASAQCTPNPQYADSTFGVWPDTLTNLPCAFGDQSTGYNAVIDLKTLTDTSVSVDLQGNIFNIEAYIEKFRINAVEGLPSGFTYIPNTNEWTNTGTAPNFSAVQGCVSILANQASVQAILAANPTGVDIPLTVIVDAKIKNTNNPLANFILSDRWLSEVEGVPGIAAIPVTGYRLRVRQSQADGCGPVSIGVEPQWAKGMQIAPNPVVDQANLIFQLAQPETLTLRIFNAQGQIIAQERVQGMAGENRVDLAHLNLSSGLYIYTLGNDQQEASKTFIVSAE